MAILKDDRQNLLINGAFDFWQRGTSTSGNTEYIADRWRTDSSLTQTTSRVSDLSLGTDFAARVTKSGGLGFYQLVQPLESFLVKSFAGKTVNFSVYLKANATLAGGGTVRLVQRWGTGNDELFPSGGAEIDFNIDATNLSTTQYIRYDFSFTVPSNATSYSVSVRILDDVANASQLDMKNIMLVEGDKPPTRFQRAGRTIEEELALCQRYYEKSYDVNADPGTAIRPYKLYTNQSAATTGGIFVSTDFLVVKRATPTVELYDEAGNGPGRVTMYQGFFSAINNIVGSIIGGARQRGFTAGASPNAAPSKNGVGYHWTADAEL